MGKQFVERPDGLFVQLLTNRRQPAFELGCAQIKAFQKFALIKLNSLTETHGLTACYEPLELNGVDQKSSGFEFDRVTSRDQRVRVMGQHSLPQQAERLAEAFARLRLSAVFPKQGGELGP